MAQSVDLSLSICGYCPIPENERLYISFATDDETYTLNGNALAPAYPEIDPILKKNSKIIID